MKTDDLSKHVAEIFPILSQPPGANLRTWTAAAGVSEPGIGLNIMNLMKFDHQNSSNIWF